MSKKYKDIAVLYGSDSSEWEVSVRSGEFTASQIEGYNVYEILAIKGRWELVAFRKDGAARVSIPEKVRPQIDKSNFSVSMRDSVVKFDYVFIMQHGAPGETGQIQGYFEMLGIPYSSTDSHTSAIVFDKFTAKCCLRALDPVKMADDALVSKGDDIEVFCKATVARLGLPLFVKPTDGGSSFGVTKVTKAEELPGAIEFAFSESNTAIVEKFISGRELTCAAWSDGWTVRALPIIEIVSQNEYFDYDAKYNGFSSEICPAPVPDKVAAEVQETTVRIFRKFGCKGIVRMDYILSSDGLYFLEINTIPGMTSASLVPKMVRTAGMEMPAFLSSIIEGA